MKEKEQIWIAGGIGITPFLSLVKDMYLNKVKLIWCVNDESEAVYADELRKACDDNPNISFRVWPSKKNGLLTIDQLGINEYEDKGYLICGPQSLKSSMTKQLKQKGVKTSSIYDEEFAFR